MNVFKNISSAFGGPCVACNSVIVSLLTILVLYYRRSIHIIIKTFPRDIQLIARFSKTGYYLFKYLLFKENIISLFEKQVAANPDKVVFYFEDKKWTLKELDAYGNKIAKIFQKQGYKKGDVVALLSYNRPEYVGIWIGLAKIGVVTALINTNLKSQSLAHCVNVAKCKGFIFTPDFAKDVNEIRCELPSGLQYIIYGAAADFQNVNFNLCDKLSATGSDPVTPDEQITAADKVIYIYTSGTTGLPKAAIITHRKLVYIACGLKCILGLQSSDIVYNPLPLYHTAGGLIGTVPIIIYGMSAVIRAKFSASNYFADCIKYKCTVGQYIGEICRYLLAVPPSMNDTSHSLRMVVGNGLRPDVWKIFVERFRIPAVLELYGSTEGNANIVNFDNTIGAVGFIPRLLPAFLFPIALIRYDEETGEPMRDENGLCIRCKPCEAGMCVGIINRKDPIREFQGYVDEKETSKKIIQNVFKSGDEAFLSGDVLYLDEYGYLFFKDRTGDTFRWKGENVSTGEIEMVVSKLIGLKDCTVYGVQVGTLEGRAGMLAIADPRSEVDLKLLAEGLDKNLPNYARPLFVRIVPELKFTGTYKIQKTELRNEGFDVHIIRDKLYYKNPKTGFVPLTESLYTDILNGVVKV